MNNVKPNFRKYLLVVSDWCLKTIGAVCMTTKCDCAIFRMVVRTVVNLTGKR